MNPSQSHSAEMADAPQLDALVVTLDGELAALRLVHFRLTVLRLVLLEGNPAFIQAAAQDLECAARTLLDNEPNRDGVVSAARGALGLTQGRLADLVALAPASHRSILHRLSAELDATSRSVAVLRDAVRRLSEDGRRAVIDVLDLTESTKEGVIGDDRTGQVFVGEF